MRDQVNAAEGAVTELVTSVIPPAYPCVVCGKDTLEHVAVPLAPHERVVPDSRICASAVCRHVHPIPASSR